MTVRPILFSGPMVRALLEGRKTQTRRVLKPQPKFLQFYEHKGQLIHDSSHRSWCSHGRAHGRYPDEYRPSMLEICGFAKGDMLWVKETWRVDARFDRYKPRELPRTAHPNLDFLATAKPDDLGLAGKTRTSFFMPRWASRLTLRVTEVRVQRLQEISEEDARAEGMSRSKSLLSADLFQDYRHPAGAWLSSARDSFSTLWDSLNAKRDGGAFSWDSNPWVVAVSFKVIQANVDQIVEA